MLIGYNARLLTVADLRGWNRYTINLLEALMRRGVEPILYTDRPIHAEHAKRLGGAVVRVSPKVPYDVWEQLWLPRQAQKDRVAALHSPFNFGLPWFSSCLRILTLHDAIDQVYASESSSLAGLRERLRHWSARTRADRVITVSEHAKTDLVRHLHIPPAKIAVIHEAADPRFHRRPTHQESADVMHRFALNRPYFFYVGGWERRKNIPFLVRAFADAALEGVELVLAGGQTDHRDELTRLGSNLGLGDRLRLIGRVDDADLPALYSRAIAFVYPSEYEGFGLQLCEAMALGVPVLAANATSLPEVLGEGGEPFELNDPAGLIGLLRRLASDPEFRDRQARRAAARSADFSWDRTADATLEVYREAGAS